MARPWTLVTGSLGLVSSGSPIAVAAGSLADGKEFVFIGQNNPTTNGGPFGAAPTEAEFTFTVAADGTIDFGLSAVFAAAAVEDGNTFGTWRTGLKLGASAGPVALLPEAGKTFNLNSDGGADIVFSGPNTNAWVAIFERST